MSALLIVLGGQALVEASSAQELEHFERRVRPVLAEQCYSCHGPDKQRSDLRVDHISFLLQGGERGPAIIPGDAEGSRLIGAVRYDDVSLQMPPRHKLPDEQIADLAQWVASGAPWPEEALPGGGSTEKFDLSGRRLEHWSWQPVQPHEAPAVRDEAWARDSLDAFILAGLEAQDLTPAPEADRQDWIRRVYFDLIGLPPTPEQVAAFVNDESPDAYEKVVDSLLASPRFGERWARHWMDLVRYAETVGHQYDYPIHEAWRYRDYLIRAFNDDLPYDQFMTEHIAGDMLENPRMNPDGYNESILATAFYFFNQAVHAPVDVKMDTAERVENQIDVLSKTFMAKTISCARCHDHKLDAISQDDYYALAGFLQSARQQWAFLDQNGRIADGARRMRRIADENSQHLARALPEARSLAARQMEEYLLATHGQADQATAAASSNTAARNQRLDEAMLNRWNDAVGNTDDPSHPLYTWARLTTGGDDGSFTERREALAQELEAEARRRREFEADYTVFEDFTRPDYEGWYPSGEAFGEGPTGFAQWDPRSGDNPRWLRPNVAHSSAAHAQLQGALRSRTFVIDHDYIHFRIMGRGARIRVAVENYQIDFFHQRLFEGLNFNVAAEDGYIWHTVYTGRYRGARAHIEFLDQGGAWLGVDEIRFSDSETVPAVPEPVSDVALRVANSNASSPAELAQVYQREIAAALARFHTRRTDESDRQLLQVLMDGELLQIQPQVNTALARNTQRLDEIVRRTPAPIRALAAADGTGVDEFFFVRGSPHMPGDPVPRRVPEALGGLSDPPIGSESSGRLELARRLLDERNPLTERVMVNRVWHHLFGQGIVPTTDDFGVLGMEPTHPELLDHLAHWYRHDAQWSTKALIRRLVLSSTYRMSSAPHDPRAEEIDPSNNMLHRMRIRRLQGEPLRDAMLAISGRLDTTMYGKSVPIHLTSFMDGRGRPRQSGPLDGDGRRSVYIEVRRNFLSPMMLAFDMPVPSTTMGSRTVSNVPAQALILMNDPFVYEQAERWAHRILSDRRLRTVEQRIERMAMEAFGRPLEEAQVQAAVAFLKSQGELYGLDEGRWRDDESVWSDLCHVFFNMKDFAFLS